MTSWRIWLLAAMIAIVPLAASGPSFGQDGGGGNAATVKTERGFLDFIKSGGVVGHTLMLLSLVGGGLVIDSFLHLKSAKLMPPDVVAEIDEMSRKGRFSQLLTFCKGNEA
ncbi:MAG: hypothetical protein ACE15C_08535 [Phycisphaerae bacterium]